MLYADPDTGQAISTHSLLKTFRRCPRQTYYKYVHRLTPKNVGKPLKRGTWVHKLLEVHYKGGDWKEEHQRLSRDFNRLFDEEKDFYGDLPREIYQIMQSYFWHYANHDWKVLDAEFVLEVELPDGALFRCKIDLLVEDQFGLWIVDHKSHKRLPSLDYRILDAQSGDYIWAALKNGLKVQGHIWNYIRWKAPTKPSLLKSGRLSHKVLDTDYPTFAKALKEYGIDPRGDAWAMQKLKHLKGLRYEHGMPQRSTYLRRDVLEKTPALLNQVARELYHTHKRMNEYPWDSPELIERVPEQSCTFLCSYTDVCAAELWGNNMNPIIKSRYKVVDPMAYYHDEREVADGST